MESFKEALRSSYLNVTEFGDRESEETTVEDLYELIGMIDPEDYELVADILLDVLDEDDPDFYPDDLEESEDGDDDSDEDDLDEARFTGKKKGVRKFDRRKTALKRDKRRNKAAKRKSRIKYKKTKHKNKAGKKRYRATYNKAVKSGQHKKKIHR